MSKGGILADLSEINHFSCCSETTVEENGDDFWRSWCILMFAYVEASKEELTVINDTINLKEMLGFSEPNKTYHSFLESELKGN